MKTLDERRAAIEERCPGLLDNILTSLLVRHHLDEIRDGDVEKLVGIIESDKGYAELKLPDGHMGIVGGVFAERG